ncbi:hypothetical protein [Dactylosporangium sp. CS-033363]|uniref:hypothetical protein n=1 Tax=Dactylosporangium sp. CS-033363 TaxID=3239935 RepID=UPI003D9437DB
MPSQLHEILIEMFRERPALAAEILGGPLRVTLPKYARAQLSSADLTDIAPTEYRADAVVTLHDSTSQVMGVVVEVQLRKDARKRHSWPAYVGTLRARLGCPIALLVMCPDQAVADWCAAPVTIGPPGSVLTPVALGPRQVPAVTDIAAARSMPELAVLSALAHGASEEPRAVLEALVNALDAVDQEHANLYTDLVLSTLPAAARKCLEELVTIAGYRFQSEFALRNFAEGEAKGKAEGGVEALLTMLDVRGVEVPETIRAEIANCTDMDQIKTWVRRAATAEKIEDLGIQPA